MRTFSILIICIFFVTSCKKEGKNGSDGFTSLINIILEPAGNNCPSGGFKIETGIDLNRNSVLDQSEIENTEFVCNGSSTIDNITFGATQTGFSTNTVYRADTDGFLTVHYMMTTFSGAIDGRIFSDASPNPTEVVGMVSDVPGATTVPIKADNYWKVNDVLRTTAVISWIPLK